MRPLKQFPMRGYGFPAYSTGFRKGQLRPRKSFRLLWRWYPDRASFDTFPSISYVWHIPIAPIRMIGTRRIGENGFRATWHSNPRWLGVAEARGLKPRKRLRPS